MPPITPFGKLSLTKFLDVDLLVAVLAQLVPGVDTAVDVERKLADGNSIKEMFNDIVTYDPPLASATAPAGAQVLKDDELLRAARDGRSDAHLLAWCALLLADGRLETITRDILTDVDGQIRPQVINRDALQAELIQHEFLTDPTSYKMTTNILTDLIGGRLLTVRKQGPSVIGVDALLPTSHAVPGLLELLKDRLQGATQTLAPLQSEMTRFALSLGANHWLNLIPVDFERAAHPSTPITKSVRPDIPGELAEVARQLARKNQVVLQGPPGSGKTYLAKRYVDWATAGRRSESRLQAVLDGLPKHERTVIRVADEVERLGLAACWDIVQVHPSYEYTDFVRALVATPVAGGVSFTPVHRVFSFVCALGEELERRGLDVELVLILDELNRGNVAAIFGELLYALEYRGEPVATPYEVEGSSSITVPKSLRVVGTMNTADRSIALIDYALRRRFVFLDTPATANAITSHGGYFGEGARAVALALFERVGELLEGAPLGIRVGPSYFLPSADASSEDEVVAALAEALIYEVLPLLGEYEAESEVDSNALKDLRDAVGIQPDLKPDELIAAVAAAIRALPEPTA